MDTKIKIMTLAPMQVVAFHGFGDQPEINAWAKLQEWAETRGFWARFDEYPVFGFNNPSPSHASPNYGYELWICGTRTTEDEPAGVTTKYFPGGLYAVLRCPVPRENYDVIGEKWKELVAWREQSPYAHGSHQWLEKSVTNHDPALEFVLDLYLPIVE